jgi:aminomethyltransferase
MGPIGRIGPTRFAHSPFRQLARSPIFTAMVKTSPLHNEHLRLGAKLIEFAGWQMPVFYSSIVNEHLAVRSAAGIFDISHMGEIEVSGQQATSWLNGLLTNDINKISPNESQYTFLLNERGGVIDDLIAYRSSPERFFLVVNAAKTEEDFARFQTRRLPGVNLINQSADFAAMAVQGPAAASVFASFGSLPSRNHCSELKLDGVAVIVARTGYSGEDGFELFCPTTAGPAIWRKMLEAGRSIGLQPCGLGARDTLRMEVCYPLNGNDLSPERTPLEAGLGFFVDLKKADFAGRESLLAQKAAGIRQKLVAIKLQEKGPPPRPHYPIFAGADQIGELTSGTQSPSLGAGIGLGYVDVAYSQPAQKVQIDIRGRKFAATVEKKPLYKGPC